MKTIEERAKEWIDSLGAGLVHPYNRQAMIDAYIAGAKAQYEELTRWHDPKEPPEPGLGVLVKRNPSSIIPYDLGHIDNDGNWMDSWCDYPIDDKIIGWRKIHE